MPGKSLSIWRMTFVEGYDGSDVWELCFEQGVAVLGGWSRVDLTCVPRDQFREAYLEKCEDRGREPSSSSQSNHSKFLYDMKEGDWIYAKSGSCIVGRGKVVGPSEYNAKMAVLDKRLSDWAYFRRVEWQRRFVPIPKELAPLTLGAYSAPLHAVLRLEGKRLAELLEAEKKARGKRKKES